MTPAEIPPQMILDIEAARLKGWDGFEIKQINGKFHIRAKQVRGAHRAKNSCRLPDYSRNLADAMNLIEHHLLMDFEVNFVKEGEKFAASFSQVDLGIHMQEIAESLPLAITIAYTKSVRQISPY